MTTTNVGDTPMHRKKVTELTDAELDILLEEKRQRRYSIIKKYEETQEAKRRQENEKAKAELDKQLRIMEKDIGTIDRALERAEGRLNKIRALRLQYEDDFDPSTDT
jgi:septal ring factor EnvC (AmiA/AmiB activator)